MFRFLEKSYFNNIYIKVEQIWKYTFDPDPTPFHAKLLSTILTTLIIIFCCLYSLFKITNKFINNGMIDSSDMYNSCPLCVSVWEGCGLIYVTLELCICFTFDV